MVAPRKPRRVVPRKPVELRDGPKIEMDCVYPAVTFCGIVGWGPEALKSARAGGLRVRRSFGRVFITGRDFLHYLDAQDRGAAERN